MKVHWNGLLSADHVLAGVRQPAFPATLIQGQNWAGAVEEPRVAWEHPRALLPRPQCVLIVCPIARVD